MLTYFASEDIYLTGCEVLEKPEALDVTFRIVSLLPARFGRFLSAQPLAIPLKL